MVLICPHPCLTIFQAAPIGLPQRIATVSNGGYGPSAGALDAESPKCKKRIGETKVGHETNAFLTDVHHILHARSCIIFLWFTHSPSPLGL